MKKLVLGLSIALAGCSGMQYWGANVTMRNQCHVSLQHDPVALQRCLDDVNNSPQKENYEKLVKLMTTPISQERCLARVAMREQTLNLRFRWPHWSEIDIRQYFQRTQPRTGPDAISDAEIWADVAWGYSGPCLHCGYDDLLDANQRTKRMCLGLSPEPPARPAAPPPIQRKMEEWYGSAQ